MEIAESELIAALQAALMQDSAGDAPGFLTSEELRAATGFKDIRLRHLLRVLQKDGRLDVGRRYVTDLAGRRIPVPVYRLKT